MFVDIMESPVGLLEIRAEDQFLLSVRKVEKSLPTLEKNLLTQETKKQLEAYFHGTLKVFQLPLSQNNTSPFITNVYSALCQILYGQKTTYKDLAVKVGSPLAFRAVGSAMAKNPYMIIVPCHRVLTSQGKIGGYAWGVDTKNYLLELEKRK